MCVDPNQHIWLMQLYRIANVFGLSFVGVQVHKENILSNSSALKWYLGSIRLGVD